MVPLLLKSWKQAADIWAFLLYNSMLALSGVTAHLQTLVLLSACIYTGDRFLAATYIALSQTVHGLNEGVSLNFEQDCVTCIIISNPVQTYNTCMHRPHGLTRMTIKKWHAISTSLRHQAQTCKPCIVMSKGV